VSAVSVERGPRLSERLSSLSVVDCWLVLFGMVGKVGINNSGQRGRTVGDGDT
jgi:hypothetical protein